MTTLEPLSPVYTAPLFEPLHNELISLLDGLAPHDWARPTLAGSWRVRDVVAHLLEVDLRRLSVGRDAHLVEPGRTINGYPDLVAFLNELNAQWVIAARRFSPRVLIDLLRESGLAMARFVTGVPPHDPAPFAVAWAGESRSENWFDIGRDYTERWHHQMQIRDAVGGPYLLDSLWLMPLLDLSVRSLPPAYAGIHASPDVSVTLEVTADPEAVWTLRRVAPAQASGTPTPEVGAWRLWRGASPPATTTVRLDAETAWRSFYNALPPGVARQRAAIEGDARLAEPLFRARAVMV